MSDSAATNSTATAQPMILAVLRHIEDAYGALLLGTFFSLILYGIILHQAYRYMRLHPHDYVYIRVLIVVSLIFETLQCVFSMHASYYWLVTNYFNPPALDGRLWSFNLIPAMTGLSMVATHLFFVRGVWLIGQNFKYSSALAVLSLATELGFSLAITIRLFQSRNPLTFFVNNVAQQEGHFIHGQFAAATVAHIVITATLVYVLRGGQASLKESRPLVNTLMIYVINTGLLVSVCDVISWILAFTLPGTAWWAGFQLVTVRLYMITFLAVLNSRRPLTNGGSELFGGESTTLGSNFLPPSQRIATAERYRSPQSSDRSRTRIDIKVTTEVEDGEGDMQTSRGSVLEEGKMPRM